MPLSTHRYRFAWRAFDDRVVAALAAAEGCAEAEADPRAFLSRRVPRPDEDFVSRHRDVLVRSWLSRYPGTPAIVSALCRRGGAASTPRARERLLLRHRRTAKLRRTLLAAMLRYGDADRSAAAPGRVPRFELVTPSELPPDSRVPHDYQREAWEQLSAHLSESQAAGVFRGMLAMPTGAGKGYTAAHWLARRVLSEGGRVLWVAHRHELLEQAARELRRCAVAVTGVDHLRIRVVSGKHCAVTQIDPADHIVIASVASLSARPDVRDALLSDPRLFLVVDEAHHAPAKTYRKLLDGLAATAPTRVLGLTATPTRTAARERASLSRLFGDRVLYQVSLRRLVERRMLARPLLVRVATGEAVEDGATESDRAHLRRYGQLSEEWLARIGDLSERNRLIVDHYLANRSKYGKTLMFAVNVRHAALLAHELRERGVRAEYVAHYRPDGSSRDTAEVIASMRAGELEVLVNVQILTEGVDLPSVETVFLARPTQSEILFRQMVGRALRGPSAGGTETAHLVTFQDQWCAFPNWEHPFELVPDIVEVATAADKSPGDDPPPPRAHPDDTMALLPWSEITAAAAEHRRTSPAVRAAAFEAVPHGYYLLPPVDVGGPPHPIVVYAHHRDGWESLLNELHRHGASETCSMVCFEEAFGDCEEPRPSPVDVEFAMTDALEGRERPKYVSLEERATIDPRRVAERIRERDLGELARIELITERYGALASIAYPALPDYAAAVDEALHGLRYGVST